MPTSSEYTGNFNHKYNNGIYKPLQYTSCYKCPPYSKYYQDFEGGRNCICPKSKFSQFKKNNNISNVPRMKNKFYK